MMAYTLDSWWSPNFNSANYKKTGFTIHHAATTDFSGIGRTFQNTARQASAHYGVEPGHVQQYVADKDVAWHAGNSWANSYTIGIECVNSGGEAQGWPVAEETVNTLVEFMADKCREHGISELKVGSNLFGHKDFSATFCMPVDETELLTLDGWVLLSDVCVGDEVACVRLDDLALIWSPVRKKVNPYVSDTWLSRDFEATADHRMIARTQKGKHAVKTWAEVCGCTNKESTNQSYIPNAAFMDSCGIDISDEEIDLLAAIQADASYMREMRYGDNHVYGVRFHFSKQRKIDSLIDLLESTGFDYRHSIKGDGTHDIRCGKDLYEWAERYLENKEFSWRLMEMSIDQKKLFIDRIQDWDGCRDNRSYSSFKKKNIDIVQAIAASCGIGTKSTDDRVYFKSFERSVSNANAKRVKKKIVSCVTVDTGFILVRQHGRTTVTGNCPGVLYDRLNEIANRVNSILNGEDMAITDEDAKKIADQVWRYILNSEDGDADAGNYMREIRRNTRELTRTDDPTGRGVGMNDHDHIKWIAKEVSEIKSKL